jgi:hypothetical protein
MTAFEIKVFDPQGASLSDLEAYNDFLKALAQTDR